MKKFLLLVFICFQPVQVWGKTYYVSTSGDDSNSGTSEKAPWRSLFKLNRTPFAPGDSIRLKRGDRWVGALAAPIIPATNGAPGRPITWGAYGSGPRPVLTFASYRNRLSDWHDEGNNIWSTGGFQFAGEEMFPNPNSSQNAPGWYHHCTGRAICGPVGRTAAPGQHPSAPAVFKFQVADHGTSSASLQLYTASSVSLRFVQGKYYLLTFRAKCTAPFTIPAVSVKSHRDGADPTGGMMVQALTVGEKWSKCSVILRADRHVAAGGVNLLLGGEGGIPNGATCCIDSLSLREIKDDDFFGMYYCSNLIFGGGSGATTTGVLVQSGRIARQGEWFQSPVDRKIRLYSTANPAQYYGEDVAIVHGAPRSGFWLSNKQYHVFEDIHFFALPSGWNGLDFSHVVIQNCAASYTGGVPGVDPRDYHWSGGSFRVRGGGAVGASGNICDWIVRNNDFRQSYDANITWENGAWHGWGNNKKADGIEVYGNVFGLAHYNLEFGWNGAGSSMSNVHIYHNTLYDAGYEWSAGQRPDEPVQKEDAHIKCWNSPATGKNIRIENNIMDGARSQLLYFSDWRQWSSVLTMQNNIYYGACGTFAFISGVSYPTLGAFQDHFHQDSSSRYTDPLFRSKTRGDFRLADGSPAVSLGAYAGTSRWGGM
ncbi:hypothetical protein [Geomesophilobacter sediminis]|uniref:Right handed beta helix domain-containing protein n=1 Tax=Geomesophilobacter sediminis TaxID=2798584 RepID=A0A8J7JB32_9BACT|nr:hypothetical protein [Geomesophilobacter sediminis]MBJ6724266.1 hypothetical protein [Geomesophilobacter sediminis]